MRPARRCNLHLSLSLAHRTAYVCRGSGGAKNSFLTLDQILDLWSRGVAIAAFVVIILLIVFNASFIWVADRDVRVGRLEKTSLRFRVTIFLRTFTAGEPVQHHHAAACSIGRCNATQPQRTVVSPLQISLPSAPLASAPYAPPPALPGAGLFSGFVGMFSKASVSIFASSVGNVSDNLARVEPWIFIVLLICCLVCQVYYLNSGE